MGNDNLKTTRIFVEQNVKLISSLHEGIITESGGEQGIRDYGGLYNSVYKILQYQENHNNNPAAVGAFVYKELAGRHHFNDGNKRTAHASAKIILFLMGFHLQIKYKESIQFILRIASYQSEVTFGEIKGWINKHIIPIPREDIAKYLNEVVLDIKDGNKK